MATVATSLSAAASRIALKLRRAEERFIPQSTRAASFKRLLGSNDGEGSSCLRGGWRCDKRRHVSHKTVGFVEVDGMSAPVVFDEGGIGQPLCELLKSP